MKKLPSQFLGFIYDNAAVRSTVRSIHGRIEEIVESRSTSAAPGEFRGISNYRNSRDEKKILKDLLRLEDKIKSKVLIDRKKIYRGVTLDAIVHADRHQKATSKRYLDDCMALNPADPERLDDIKAIFLTVDPAGASMRLKAVPVRSVQAASVAWALPAYLEKLNTQFFSEATTGNPREDHTPRLRNPLRQLAQDALRSKYADDGKIHICFYENGHQGCVLGDNFTLPRMQRLTGMDLAEDSDAFLVRAWFTLGLTKNEKAAFEDTVYRYLPSADRKAQKALSRLKL